MTNKKAPVPGSDEHWEIVRKKAKAVAEQLANADVAQFDERGLISGSDDSLNSTDADSFPSERDEYKPEERKPRLVPCKKD